MDESDKVSEIEGGCIVKTEDTYQVWLEAGKDAETVLTTEGLTSQANGVDSQDAKEISDLKHDLQPSEDSLLIAEMEETITQSDTIQSDTSESTTVKMVEFDTPTTESSSHE